MPHHVALHCYIALPYCTTVLRECIYIMCNACTYSSWKALEREYCLEIGFFMYPCADTDTDINAVRATPPRIVVVAGDILIVQ